MRLYPNATTQDPAVAAQPVAAGQQRGLLTVITRSRGNNWVCQCQCGRFLTRTSHYLRKNPIPQCGCKRVLNERDIADYAGMTVGFFTALRHDPVKRVDAGGWPLLLCRCVCGQIVRLNVRDFLGRRYESCGCIKRLRGRSLGNRPRSHEPRSHKLPLIPKSRESRRRDRASRA